MGGMGPGRIRMRVVIDNESDAHLRLVKEQLDMGDYTPGPGAGWRPPDDIYANETREFRAEGGLFVGEATTGTDGYVRYNIIADDGSGKNVIWGELYIHWDSPLVESQYGNTFHVWAPPNWEVSSWGGQGHEATLTVRLRRTQRRSVPHFNPHGRAFNFTNKTWEPNLPVMTIEYLWNKYVDSLPAWLQGLGLAHVPDLDPGNIDWGHPITSGSGGLCGGMVFSVMDYYNSQQLPGLASSQQHAHRNEDGTLAYNKNGTQVLVNNPELGDPLGLYIRDRLWDSFDLVDSLGVPRYGYRYLLYSLWWYPDGDEDVANLAGIVNIGFSVKAKSWITYREEWPKIQADIDNGQPSPLGLVQVDDIEPFYEPWTINDIGHNHQVLAYAYERCGQQVTLFVYDPNEPWPSSDTVFGAAVVALRFDLTRTDGPVEIFRWVESDGNIEDSSNWTPPDQQVSSTGRKLRIHCLFRTEDYASKVPPAGRRFTSVGPAILAATDQGTHYGRPGESHDLSFADAVAADGMSGSATAWLQSL